jgi:hypothetical protein
MFPLTTNDVPLYVNPLSPSTSPDVPVAVIK